MQDYQTPPPWQWDIIRALANASNEDGTEPDDGNVMTWRDDQEGIWICQDAPSKGCAIILRYCPTHKNGINLPAWIKTINEKEPNPEETPPGAVEVSVSVLQQQADDPTICSVCIIVQRQPDGSPLLPQTAAEITAASLRQINLNLSDNCPENEPNRNEMPEFCQHSITPPLSGLTVSDFLNYGYNAPALDPAQEYREQNATQPENEISDTEWLQRLQNAGEVYAERLLTENGINVAKQFTDAATAFGNAIQDLRRCHEHEPQNYPWEVDNIAEFAIRHYQQNHGTTETGETMA